MNTEKLSWSGDATVTVNNIEHSCNLDCDVEISTWQERHEPFYSESMSEPLISLGQFEAECGGQPVHDGKVRRDIRMALAQWIEDNEQKIIREAK